MSTKDVLAIDFGTTNSYYSKCPGDHLSPKGVDFLGDGRDGLATAILYRPGKSSLIGHTAMEEFGEATARERTAYTLRTHFKPDIVTGGEARKCSIDFLRAVLDEASHQRLDLVPTSRQVIFGVPSEAKDDFRQALAEVAREAGYGEIRMEDEPKGALLYHLYNKDIAVRDALSGLLVIDFGGGTCDFAFLRRGKVLHSWGDMRLGGRLFDDLFFQWLLDSNPSALEEMQKDGSEYLVHSYFCRELKESFSKTMTRDRNEPATKAVRHYGRIVDMTWQGFLERARSYSPSRTLLKYLAEIGGCQHLREGSNGSIDLIAWFRDSLIEGIREARIDKSDIRFVVLAGGSSQWVFVRDVVRDELGIEPERIMRSDRPYAAISEGLSLQPALQAQLRATKEKLKQELPQFCEGEIKPLLAKRLENLIRDIAGAITQELFDEKLKPVLVEFRTRRGSVAALKKRLATVAASFEPRLRGLIEERTHGLAAGLPSQLNELLAKWFDKHDLAKPDDDLNLDAIGPVAMRSPDVAIPDFSSIIGVVSGMTAVVVSNVVASICGGGGMALIASGPLGWIIGAVLGLVIAGLAIWSGVDKAKQMAEEWRIPPWIVQRILTDGKIAKTREQMHDHVESAVQSELSDIQTVLATKVSEQVDGVIEALSDINRL